MPTFTKIASVTVGSGGASSISFSSISQSYTDLVLKISNRDGRTGIAVSDIRFNFNGAGVGTNISGRYGYGDGTSATTSSVSANGELAFCDAAGATTSTFGNAEVYIANYTSSNYKAISSESVAETNATGGYNLFLAGLWSNTAAITSITMTPFTSPFSQFSTATLYGIKNS